MNDMKTAEKWVRQQRNKIKLEHPQMIRAQIRVLATHEFIKQIQLDAYKAGMTMAAEMAYRSSLPPITDYGRAKRDTQLAIISARDDLKETP